MKLTREQQDTTANRWTGWHILTVAEVGFSMLDIYSRRHGSLDIHAIREFADRVNERNEAGTLHPRAPISAIPRRIFREQADSRDPAAVNDLKRHIAEFLVTNDNTIHAQQILIDLHVSPAPVPARYIDAAEVVVRSHGEGSVREVVIFT